MNFFAIGAALGGVAILGTGTYRFLKVPSIEDLFRTYPAGAGDYLLSLTDPNALKPNIIVIYCDDLEYGDLGCYGNQAIRTPAIDDLARTGTRFTDYYACSAVCAPSRTGLLTGRYPFQTGIIGNPFPKEEPYTSVLARKVSNALKSIGVMDTRENVSGMGLSEIEITLAERLRRAGYRTGMVGKWHLGDYSKQPEFNLMRHGFDT